MSAMSRRERARRIRELLETEGAAVRENTQTFNDRRYDALRDLDDVEGLRSEARRIKEAAIEDLPSLLSTLETTVEANGGRVHHATDAAEARSIVAGLLEDHQVETVVKSKSMTTEEIDLNDAIEAAGMAVWETDLGEFVVQLADESPSHITGPAIHRSRSSIAELFAEAFDLEAVPETPDELTAIARSFLGERIREADAAVTGANFVAAESGTVALVTSEGNARKCVASTPLHVAVAGVEKVVPTVDDLEAFVQLLARSATGQAQSAYLSLFTPPLSAPSVDFDRPEEPIGTGEVDRAFHLVLLDNGRFDLRDDDELRETLYCIRCSACANSCANFQHVGGHAFGGETYSGGIATGWEAGVHGLASAGSFNDLCTGCTRCAPNCPVKIDIPWINTVVRDRLHRVGDDGRFDSLVDGLTPGDASAGLDARLFARVDRLLALASAAAPVSNWLAGTRPVRALLERTVGIDPRRPLPRVAREPFSAWAADRSASPASAEVVLYPDVYTEYLGPARGRAALRLLEALGLEVAVPSVPESGRAAFSQGLVEPSRDRAEAVEAVLRPHLTAGRPVVAIEPSDLAMFRREYARLLPEGQANRVAAGTFDLLEFVEAHLGDRPPAAVGIPDGDGRRAVYHPHCQGRTLGLAEPTVSLLERCGYEVSVTSAECCGMAGSFGYTVDHYDLSVAVGESLVEEVAAHDPEVVLASGTSCLEQLEHLGERQPRHPVHVLDPAG